MAPDPAPTATEVLEAIAVLERSGHVPPKGGAVLAAVRRRMTMVQDFDLRLGEAFGPVGIVLPSNAEEVGAKIRAAVAAAGGTIHYPADAAEPVGGGV